jgi:RNA polymerase sigma factor (sigma-70 family)
MHTHHVAADDLYAVPEAILYEQVQAGCKTCLDHLMSRHEGLVVFVVRRQTLGQLSFVEAVHAGRVGLWRAILGFDPRRGYAFSTYAYPAIARHIWQAVKQAEQAGQTVSPSVAGIAVATIDALDPAVIWKASVVNAALYDLVRRLPERLRSIIMARYGLAGKSPTTYREIGASLGLTGERVRQLHTEALVWLRHPAHSQQLRSLLACHRLEDYEWADDLAQRWLRRRRGGRYGSG